MARLSIVVFLAAVAAANSQYVGVTPFGYSTTAHSFSLPYVGGFRYGFPALAAPVAAPLAAPLPYGPALAAPFGLPAPFAPAPIAPVAPAVAGPVPVGPVPAGPVPAIAGPGPASAIIRA